MRILLKCGASFLNPRQLITNENIMCLTPQLTSLVQVLSWHTRRTGMTGCLRRRVGTGLPLQMKAMYSRPSCWDSKSSLGSFMEVYKGDRTQAAAASLLRCSPRGCHELRRKNYAPPNQEVLQVELSSLLFEFRLASDDFRGVCPR